MHTNSLGVIVVCTLLVAFGGFAITTSDVDIRVRGVNFLEVRLHAVFIAIPHSIEKPNLAVRVGCYHCIQHAQHRRQANTTPDKDNRTITVHVEKKLTAGRAHV